MMYSTDENASAALGLKCLVQEESKPDALAASALPHPVHAVVPVAGADQRQAALAEPVQRTLQPAHAVLVQRFAQARARRQVVVRLLVRIDLAAFDVGHAFVEHLAIAGGVDVAAGDRKSTRLNHSN